MTRTVVYGGAMLAFTAATAMTIAANVMPTWANYVMYPTTGGSDPFWLSLGLHKSCTSDNTTPFLTSLSAAASSPASPLLRSAGTATCRSFPHRSLDCGVEPEQQVFCTIWRTIGFLMAVAFIAELTTLAGFMAVLCGGRMKREFGWRVLVPLVEFVAILQLVAMALVTYVMDHDDRFLVPGWHLGSAWTLCTVSWSVAALTGLGLALAAYILPPEDGYEFMSDSGEW
ncbi:hypothetical protein F503_02199 [Ophiostoma piceae UAMH 11346]|uniref:Pre-mrna splicing factor n=1 Tax=Ophiostoma piceae (strain UAMH 11346) TaxID=1262450 RepID=S3CX88_OPHP1|nr:hypothetical protein F503_02199 [Ophiostoma piceae UAMH 11346]